MQRGGAPPPRFGIDSRRLLERVGFTIAGIDAFHANAPGFPTLSNR